MALIKVSAFRWVPGGRYTYARCLPPTLRSAAGIPKSTGWPTSGFCLQCTGKHLNSVES
jgi:hypothetical protein